MDSAHTATILSLPEDEMSTLPYVRSHKQHECCMSEMYSIEQGVLICSTCMKYVCVTKISWRKFSTKNPTSAVPCQRTMTEQWEVSE